MSGAAPKKYQQRRPEKTVLYRVIQLHLESFLEHAHESSGKRLPKYVENEFRCYLECGAVCETCGDELLLPFSCKLRGVCPSCNTRRMSNTAAHLVDHIIAPDVTLHQWVLTVPFELRLLLAAKPDALSAIGRVFIQEIQRWQRQRGQSLGFEQAEGAAVSFCQRFGSSLNLNIRWQVIVPRTVVEGVLLLLPLNLAASVIFVIRRVRYVRRDLATLRELRCELEPER
jgi:hypothetical protein